MPLERRLRHRSMQSAYFLIRSKIRLTVLMRLAEDESMTYRPSKVHAIRRPAAKFDDLKSNIQVLSR
jgi:hypothetical protein